MIIYFRLTGATYSLSLSLDLKLTNTQECVQGLKLVPPLEVFSPLLLESLDHLSFGLLNYSGLDRKVLGGDIWLALDRVVL